MKQSKRKRTLSFEQLDTKCAPSTLLLVMAPLDDSFHVAIEESQSGPSHVATVSEQIDTSANWQFQFSTSDLLRFVNDNASGSEPSLSCSTVPSVEQCRGADEMMKLGDQDLRALVIADSLHHVGDDARRRIPLRFVLVRKRPDAIPGI